MDDLSSIGSNLPKKRTTQQQLSDLDSSLISEFKTAACAVTQLFKLSGTRTSVAKDEGYLQAIQDLLTALNDTNGQLDVVEWALKKKAEISGDSGATSDEPVDHKSDQPERRSRENRSQEHQHHHSNQHLDQHHDSHQHSDLQEQEPNPRYQHQKLYHHREEEDESISGRDTTVRPFTFTSLPFPPSAETTRSQGEDDEFEVSLESPSVASKRRAPWINKTIMDKRRRNE